MLTPVFTNTTLIKNFLQFWLTEEILGGSYSAKTAVIFNMDSLKSVSHNYIVLNKLTEKAIRFYHGIGLIQ